MTQTVERTKEVIIQLLTETDREGIDDLIEYLKVTDFFTAPASTRFHGCFEGGLASHSLGVYEILSGWHEEFDFNHVIGFNINPQPVTDTNIRIATLLHDLCKIDCYRGLQKPYSWIKQTTKGHALKSLLRINRYIKLELIEELMIRYHMGFYGLVSFDPRSGEYEIVNTISSEPRKSKEERYGKSWRNATHHNKIVKFMYFADELETIGARE
jgi:hypothetical protein